MPRGRRDGGAACRVWEGGGGRRRAGDATNYKSPKDVNARIFHSRPLITSMSSIHPSPIPPTVYTTTRLPPWPSPLRPRTTPWRSRRYVLASPWDGSQADAAHSFVRSRCHVCPTRIARRRRIRPVGRSSTVHEDSKMPNLQTRCVRTSIGVLASADDSVRA